MAANAGKSTGVIQNGTCHKRYSAWFMYVTRPWLLSGYIRPSAGRGEDGMFGHEYMETLIEPNTKHVANKVTDRIFQNVRTATNVRAASCQR